jgi:uncharacterized protein (TIGR02271 family)
MISSEEIDQVMGCTAYDGDGDKIGKVGQVYLDDQTNQPAWVTVNTGLFGSSESFVPIENASFAGDRLTVGYDKAKVKDAPSVAADGHLSHEEEQSLYEYYGLSYGSGSDYDTTTQTTTGNVHGTEGDDTSGTTSDQAMTRSEEQLRVGTTSEETGRARLRKYVETEHVSQTVPVRKERAVLETEPITDSNVGAATDGPAISEEEHEVVLREERPVVEKTVEPVERVRLGTEEVTEEHTASEDVRKERITAEGDINDGTTGGSVR